jgi:hypothetical protein
VHYRGNPRGWGIFAAAALRVGFGSGAVFEAPALVAGLEDLAMVREPVQERGRHLGIAEDARPFAERDSSALL